MFYQKLEEYINRAQSISKTLDKERQAVLGPLAEYIKQNKEKGQLIFICTHNSRRSHFGQIWAHVAALEFGLLNLRTFSGGTEATAFHPNARAAIERAGIVIDTTSKDVNPLVKLSFGTSLQTIEVFSKAYDDEYNPKKNFAAVMTCSEADADCPIVSGASTRIPLHYQDPKVSDGTGHQDQTYDERCLQIASEMFYAFEKASAK